MSRPLLQLALDHTSLNAALQSVNALKNSVDIIEAGTILCISEGLQAVRQLRQLCPEHTIVADLKVADAGETLATEAFNAGADWMTVICAAPLATVVKAHQIAQSRGGEIQIELFGNWTLDDAKAWRAAGVRQAIHHRGRDAQASGQSWSQQDLDRMQQLSDLGLELSITGGITPQDLSLFSDISVRAFIAGRALSEATNPAQVAQEFHQQINAIWGKGHEHRQESASARYLRKALPKTLSWPERLALAKSCGFDFVEMSVDETDERLTPGLEYRTAQCLSECDVGERYCHSFHVPFSPSSISLWQP